MKYLTVHEVQMAYDLLVGMNPQIINDAQEFVKLLVRICLLYTSPSPRDYAASRMPSSA